MVSPKNQKVGMEEEVIVYNANDQRMPVNKGESFSGVDLVKDLKKSFEYYSLEPGGQVEWSSPPRKSLIKLGEDQKVHRFRLKEHLVKNNLKLISYGVEPKFSPGQVELINEKKYILMDENMKKNGTMGKWKMRNTASVQINFDFTSERELNEMVFIADCLNPVCAFLFSNSPFKGGEKAKKDNLRNIIWENTDNRRCKNLIDHGIKDSSRLLDRYIDYILNVPNIFHLDSEGKVEDSEGTILDRLINLDKRGELRDEDINSCLHQIFTNVRIKRFIEVRGSDRPPLGYEMAPVAFWTGVLTEDSIRKKILDEISTWSFEDRIKFNNASLSLDGNALTVKGKKYSYWNSWFGELAILGLKNRGLGEEVLFEKFFKIIAEKGPFSLQLQKL